MFISLILIFIAGFSNAVMDTSAFHYSTSVFKTLNPNFWNEIQSAKINKKNILGFRNDVWHFAKFLMVLCIIGAMVSFNAWHITNSVFLNGIISYALLFCSWQMAFNLFYSKILVK